MTNKLKSKTRFPVTFLSLSHDFLSKTKLISKAKIIFLMFEWFFLRPFNTHKNITHLLMIYYYCYYYLVIDC